MEDYKNLLTKEERKEILEKMNDSTLSIGILVPYEMEVDGESIIIGRNEILNIKKDDNVTSFILKTFDIKNVPFIDKTKLGLIIYKFMNEKTSDSYKYFIDMGNVFRIFYHTEDYETEFAGNSIPLPKLRRQSANKIFEYTDIKECLDEIFN